MGEINYDSIKQPLQIKIENLHEGKNNIRLFRGEQIVDAVVSYPTNQSHWDDFEMAKDKRTAENTPFSVITDFIKAGVYTLIDIRVETITPIPIRHLPEKVWSEDQWIVGEEEYPVVFICDWEPTDGSGGSNPIYLMGEYNDLSSVPLHVPLTVGTQIGVQFTMAGSIMLYLNVVKTSEFEKLQNETESNTASPVISSDRALERKLVRTEKEI